jgi:hypothetical protein
MIENPVYWNASFGRVQSQRNRRSSSIDLMIHDIDVILSVVKSKVKILAPVAFQLLVILHIAMPVLNLKTVV